MMGALRPTTKGHRTRFLAPNLAAAEKIRLGKSIARKLGDVLDIADLLWDVAAADPQLWREFSRTVEVAQKLLDLIDRTMGRTIGDMTLQQAFDAGNRAAYQAELKRIKLALAKPPYQP